MKHFLIYPTSQPPKESGCKSQDCRDKAASQELFNDQLNSWYIKK